MSLPVIVLGGGGHGRVVIEALLRQGTAVAGVIDPDPAIAGLLPPGILRLGGEAALDAHPPARFLLANGVGGIGTPHRRHAFERGREQGYAFAAIRHPSAVIAEAGVVLGEGAQIMAGAVLQPGVRLGADVIVNTRAAIDHDSVIGAHCHISPGAVLCGDVTVGEDSHIGAGAVVIQGVRIGAGCLVGAGVTVRSDVPAGMVVYGERDRRPRC